MVQLLRLFNRKGSRTLVYDTKTHVYVTSLTECKSLVQHTFTHSDS